MSPVVATTLGLAVLVGVVAAFRLSRLRRVPGDLAARALFLALVCFDISLLLGIPAVYRTAFRLLGGVPALPQLIQHAATIGAVYHAQILSLAIADRDRPAGGADPLRRALRRRRWLLVVGLVVLTVAYVDGPYRLGLTMLGAGGEHDLGVAAYVMVTQLYVVVALADFARTSWLRRRTGGPYLRVGLQLITPGCAFAVLFSLHKMLYFLLIALGVSMPWNESGNAGIQLAFLGPAILCLVGGIMIPFWAPRIAAHRHRGRMYRRLAPLAAAVGVAPPPPGRNWSRSERLLHRVIHIRDALIGPLRLRLRLDAYRTGYDRGIQDGLSEDEARVVAEATCIAAALRNPPAHNGADRPPPFVLGADIDAEAAWLARVSDAFGSGIQYDQA